jgi:uncharacterized protein YllA (UPF0747 family)
MFDDLEKVSNLTDRRMLRTERRENKDLIQQRLEELHGKILQKGSLQERHDNLASYYLSYGKKWTEALYSNLDPLYFEFVVSK